MILFYTGESVEKSANMSVWNREHVWSKSLGWFETTKAGADAHHIRPCDVTVNGHRSNSKFGESDDYYNPFDPLDVDAEVNEDFRGDVARIIFYMMVRYSESDEFTWTSIAESYDILANWNDIDPVSELEINRNDYVYTIQGNRNPFIDNADYADMIWGDPNPNN